AAHRAYETVGLLRVVHDSDRETGRKTFGFPVRVMSNSDKPNVFVCTVISVHCFQRLIIIGHRGFLSRQARGCFRAEGHRGGR
ncbi:unnamed protein product, partial [Ectocarpus sp. 13 AM-2016]